MTTIDRTPQRLGAGVWHTRSHGRDLETTGLTHVPRTGGAVLAMTHFAHRELAFVELAVWRHSRRRIQCLVLNGRIEEPDAGGLFRPLRRIFVNLTAGAEAYAEALVALRHGELVALFPEAGGDDPLAVRELRVSAARLAVEADVPLVPVVVWCEPIARDDPRDSQGSRSPVSVAFGEPIAMQRAEDVRAVTDELRATLQRMLLGLLRGR
ncbi:lysophospholipid acyltransferase family protein [Lysobacter korlensis]|uniref:Lysophospholipid acyltransferase family protein n=1 Tax=Lysobacter korlensis TaxID=553636 RepID=A0ABV6S029_9GAMM